MGKIDNGNGERNCERILERKGLVFKVVWFYLFSVMMMKCLITKKNTQYFCPLLYFFKFIVCTKFADELNGTL